MAFKQIHGLKEHPLPKGEVLALWIHGLMFLFLAILAIFGFIGALTKSRSKIATFAIAVAIHLGFSVATGIFTIISVFRQGAEDQVKQCMAAGGEASTSATADTVAAASNVTEAACKSGVNIMKAAMVIIYVITWGIQLYCYFVVERYADQLAEEEELGGRIVVMPPAQQVQQVAANAATQAQNQAAPAYSAFAPSYPFSAPGAAFGNNGRAHDRV
jgi:TRAP-type C4-dicarboxylate transport system permease small subunit